MQILVFTKKAKICEKIINFQFSQFLAKNHILRKMGPGAPTTPKKGWNCIGFIRPGASGPRGTKNCEKLRKPSKTFCVFDGNSDFHAKSWEFLKIIILRSPETLVFLVKYHGLGIKCKIPKLFPATGTKSSNIYKKKAILGPKVHFWAPNAPFWVPCSKPFINTSFWEVFWGPRTGKVQLSTKKAKFRAEM